VKQPVTDRIRQGRIPDRRVPVRRRELAGDDGRARAVPIFQELEEVAPLRLLEGHQREIIQDHDVYAGQLPEEAAVGPIGACERTGLEQPGYPPVPGPVALATRLVGECTGEVTLPRAGRAADQICWCSAIQRPVASWRTRAWSSSRRAG